MLACLWLWLPQVYYFSNFTVRPANKQYATVKNDYEINFDGRSVCNPDQTRPSSLSDTPTRSHANSNAAVVAGVCCLLQWSVVFILEVCPMTGVDASAGWGCCAKTQAMLVAEPAATA